MHLIKPTATIERIASNTSHALGEGDGGEAAAIIERIASNARYTIGDCNTCYATDTFKCTLTYLVAFALIIFGQGYFCIIANVCNKFVYTICSTEHVFSLYIISRQEYHICIIRNIAIA